MAEAKGEAKRLSFKVEVVGESVALHLTDRLAERTETVRFRISDALREDPEGVARYTAFGLLTKAQNDSNRAPGDARFEAVLAGLRGFPRWPDRRGSGHEIIPSEDDLCAAAVAAVQAAGRKPDEGAIRAWVKTHGYKGVREARPAVYRAAVALARARIAGAGAGDEGDLPF